MRSPRPGEGRSLGASSQRARAAEMSGKLWEVARTGDADAVGALLDGGADPNDPAQAQRPGATPLHLASAGNFTDCVVLLLASGADPNAQNSSQRTALHVAIACDAVDSAVYLLENGARMDIKDEWGSSPSECARNAAMRTALAPYKVDPKVLEAAPIPQPEPAPENERPDVPLDDLAAQQMRLLVVSEVHAEEAETQAAADTAAAAAAGGGDEPPPVEQADPAAAAGDQLAAMQAAEAAELEEPPPLED